TVSVVDVVVGTDVVVTLLELLVVTLVEVADELLVLLDVDDDVLELELDELDELEVLVTLLELEVVVLLVLTMVDVCDVLVLDEELLLEELLLEVLVDVLVDVDVVDTVVVGMADTGHPVSTVGADVLATTLNTFVPLPEGELVTAPPAAPPKLTQYA